MNMSLRRLLAGTVAVTVLSAGAALAQAPAAKPDRWTVIHAGTLLSEVGKATKSNASIIVKNGKIEAVRDGFVAPDASMPGAAVVDLKDKFVMPGMIDAHVHVAGGRGGLPAAMKSAVEKVQGGATTVRDAGSDPQLIFPLRDAINMGLTTGPRILASGATITTTGGHGDGRNGDFHASLEPATFASGVCDGVGECQAATRRQIQLGADQVKVVATAGVGDNSDTGLEQQFTDEELKAIVTTSHLMKRKVMAHAIGAEGVKASVKAGVDSIEHGNYLDDEGAQMMKAKGVYLVATLMAPTDVLRRVRNPATPGLFPISENTRKKVLAMPEAQPGGIGRQVKVAVKNGVPMAAGTDFGGVIGEELMLMVHSGGMTPEAALKAAIPNNADLLGISDVTGTITAGKSADIVAVDGDPRKNIDVTAKPVFVMAQGHVAKAPGFMLP